ncbi:MAG: hypothetical protein HY667_02905, partial [Chloroflexi bacterium]|nr:hypothetical protein [Chloroflexota bacterium]
DAGGKGIVVDYQPSVGNVPVLADNLRLFLIGTCLIAFDSVLNQVFGAKPGKYSSDNDIHSLRAIIYMMRCAYAHTPTFPTWKIDKTQYKRKFTISEINFEIDFTSLDGKSLAIRDCGGWDGIFRLFRHCIAVIKKNSNV